MPTSSQHEIAAAGSAPGSDRPTLEYGRSMLFAMQTSAQWGHCYVNSYPVFFAFPKLFYPDGRFIEGWIVFEDRSNVILMEHGWLVSERTIIDPTIVLATDPTQTIHYYPGVVRSWEELEGLENEMFPYVRFSNYGEDGMEHPDYKMAYEAAAQKAHEIIATSSKELIEVRASDITQQQAADLPMLEQDTGMLVIHFNETGASETSWLRAGEVNER